MRILLIVLVVSCSLCSEEVPDAAADGVADNVPCTACEGTGAIDCERCESGSFPCRERCLKRDLSPRSDPISSPGWVHVLLEDQTGKIHKASRAPSEVGQIFNNINGSFVSQGKCKACGGDSRVECRNCDGQGSLVCSVCKGAKSLSPERVIELKAEKEREADANSFILKDGTKIMGKYMGTVNGTLSIKRDDGEWVEVTVEDIKRVPEQYKDRIELPVELPAGAKGEK